MCFHKYSTFCMKQNQESNCWWHDNLFCFSPIFSSQFSTAIIKYKRLFCCLLDPTSSAKLQILLYDHFTAFTQQLRTTLFYDSQFMSWIFQIGLLDWYGRVNAIYFVKYLQITLNEILLLCTSFQSLEMNKFSTYTVAKLITTCLLRSHELSFLHIFSTFIMQQQSFMNQHHEETRRVLVWILPCSDRKPNVWNCF